MKTKHVFAKTTNPNPLAARLKTACATQMLPLLLLALPVMVQAEDYTYSINEDNTITITGYTGSGGDVTIPNKIDGLRVTEHRGLCVLLQRQPDQRHDIHQCHQHRSLCVRYLYQPGRRYDS